MTKPSHLRTKLIINADDFGLTEGINRAIAELHDAGVLTSATLMANSSCFENAVDISRSRPKLGVGCHVVLVDGAPLSNPPKIPALLTGEHRMRDSLPQFLLDLQRGHIPEEQIEMEATAQIRRVQQSGINISHVDTHKHTHLFPRVARPLMRAAARCGVKAIRNPFEPSWSAQRARGTFLRRIEVTLLRMFESSFHRLRMEYGLLSTDGCLGVSATGNLDDDNLQRLLEGTSGGTFELVCHPGYNDASLNQIRTRLRAEREIERTALLATIPPALRADRVELLTFRGLVRD